MKKQKISRSFFSYYKYNNKKGKLLMSLRNTKHSRVATTNREIVNNFNNDFISVFT